jgi:hypothetical protein
MAPNSIRLATASPGTRATTAETLAQLQQFARRAAAKEVDILLLPEAYIGGYPRGTHFGCVIGGRSQGGRDEYLRYFQSAVDLGDIVGDGAGAGQAWVNRELPSDAVPGSDGVKDAPNRRGDGTREELERIARETGVFIVTGLIEKAGGSMYCSAVYVCPKLGIIGKRRKVMPVSCLAPNPLTTTSLLTHSRPERRDWYGPKARLPPSARSAPPSTGCASIWRLPSAGRTTCPWYGKPCTRKTSTSTSLPLPMAAKLGSPYSGQQPSKAAVSSSAPICACATKPQ